MSVHTDGERAAGTLPVFVAIAAAVALFAAGLVVGMQGSDMHDDRPRMEFGRMDGGMMRSEPGMMGSASGMMGSMNAASEAAFLAAMIPHHEEAIASARILEEGTERDELRDFADDIIRTQQAEVDDMRAWLRRWHPDVSPADDYQPMMRDDLDELRGDELDQAFLEDMVMHHMMAVHMARSVQRTPGAIEHDQVAKLARSIETTQRQEIADMHGWLREWFSGERRGMGMGMNGGMRGR